MIGGFGFAVKGDSPSSDAPIALARTAMTPLPAYAPARMAWAYLALEDSGVPARRSRRRAGVAALAGSLLAVSTPLTPLPPAPLPAAELDAPALARPLATLTRGREDDRDETTLDDADRSTG